MTLTELGVVELGVDHTGLAVSVVESTVFVVTEGRPRIEILDGL